MDGVNFKTTEFFQMLESVLMNCEIYHFPGVKTSHNIKFNKSIKTNMEKRQPPTYSLTYSKNIFINDF